MPIGKLTIGNSNTSVFISTSIPAPGTQICVHRICAAPVFVINRRRLRFLLSKMQDTRRNPDEWRTI